MRFSERVLRDGRKLLAQVLGKFGVRALGPAWREQRSLGSQCAARQSGSSLKSLQEGMQQVLADIATAVDQQHAPLGSRLRDDPEVHDLRDALIALKFALEQTKPVLDDAIEAAGRAAFPWFACLPALMQAPTRPH